MQERLGSHSISRGGGVQAKVESSILLGAVYRFLRVHSSSLYEQLVSRESGRKGGSQILCGRSTLNATVHRLYGSSGLEELSVSTQIRIQDLVGECHNP